MNALKNRVMSSLATGACLLFATIGFAKQPSGSQNHSRPVKTNVSNFSSMKNITLANVQVFKTPVSNTLSSKITITHGGNPPRANGNGFVITFGGNPPRNYGCGSPCNYEPCHKPCHYDCCYHNYCCVTTCCGMTYEPLHSSCVVLPGDTFYTISLREYGTRINSTYIAMYNHVPLYSALVPGQTLMLPSIGPNKVLFPSNAPAAPLQLGFAN